MLEEVPQNPYDAIRDVVKASVCESLGKRALKANGFAMSFEQREQLNDVLRPYGFGKNLLIRALGIPTITLGSVIKMGPEALNETVDAIEEAGGVPLLGA
mgnify:CR=1 FL=1